MQKVVYQSNGATVGDGTRIARVSNGGQTMEFMVDEKTGRMSPVKLVADTPTPPDQIGIPVTDEVDLLSKMANALHGNTFILSPGKYVVPVADLADFSFDALTGHSMTWRLI